MPTDLESFYEEKDAAYFQNSRLAQIRPLLPSHASRTLEIGCGTGATLQDLKNAKIALWTAGVELLQDAAEKAKRSNIDLLLQGNVEQIDLGIPPESLDLVLCLDVLEHLLDPWRTVTRLTGLLRSGGTLIVSLPNVRNIRVTLPLLLRGEWTYTPSGLMDRSHLRFFTRASAISLLESADLSVDLIKPLGVERRSKRALIAVTLGLLTDHFVGQYLVRGTKL